MKKSSLVLIIVVCAQAILVLSGYMIIDYKYKHGLYREISEDNNVYDYRRITDVKAVRLTNIFKCRVISSDSFKIGVGIQTEIKIKTIGDTLFVSDNGSSPVRIYLPDGIPVLADSSSVQLVGSALNEKLHKLSITMKKSTITTTAMTTQFRQFFGELTLKASDHSEIRFGEKVQIDILTVDLKNSMIDCTNAIVGLSRLTSDPMSKLAIQRYNESIEINTRQ